MFSPLEQRHPPARPITQRGIELISSHVLYTTTTRHHPAAFSMQPPSVLETLPIRERASVALLLSDFSAERPRQEAVHLVCSQIFPPLFRNRADQRSAKRRGCLLTYSQAEPGRELTQPSPRLLAEPCTKSRQPTLLYPLMGIPLPPLCGCILRAVPNEKYCRHQEQSGAEGSGDVNEGPPGGKRDSDAAGERRRDTFL